MPNRNFSSPAYRYGFQGQEKDDEIKGEGNSINYTFRMHDPRVGRFFAVDPLTHKYPWYSAYQFSGNRVIDMVEREGLEPDEPGTMEGQKEMAKDKETITKSYFGLWSYLFSNQEWTWHAGTKTTNEGWYKNDDYKKIIMPYAVDMAQFAGYKFGKTWQESKQLISNPTSGGELSERMNDFIATRDFDHSSGDYFTELTKIGISYINNFNKSKYFSATGFTRPMDFDSPIFLVGTLIKPAGLLTRNTSFSQRSTFQYSKYGTEAANSIEYYQLGRAANGTMLPLSHPSTLYYGRGGSPLLYDVSTYNISTAGGVPSVITNASGIERFTIIGILGVYGATKYTVDKNMNDELDDSEKPEAWRDK